MVSINQLFQNFMRLVGLNYYNKTESDNRYLSKDSVFDETTIDTELDKDSTNPVQNKIIYEEIDDITDVIEWILKENDFVETSSVEIVEGTVTLKNGSTENVKFLVLKE